MDSLQPKPTTPEANPPRRRDPGRIALLLGVGLLTLTAIFVSRIESQLESAHAQQRSLRSIYWVGDIYRLERDGPPYLAVAVRSSSEQTWVTLRGEDGRLIEVDPFHERLFIVRLKR